MIMSRETIYKFTLTLTLIFSATAASFAQSSGTYSGFSPYTIYGIGDISNRGSAYNRSMGGVGVAQRNNRYLNFLNPASVTARDSLSVMADLSIVESNIIFSQGEKKTAQNLFNISNIAFSFPVYKSIAVMAGISPYSSSGYKYSTPVNNPDVIGITGMGSSSAYGQGSVYETFLGVGFIPFKGLSVGADLIYYFGKLEKSSMLTFNDASVTNRTLTSTIIPSGFTGKLGIQYEIPLAKKSSLTLGATYKPATRMNGTSETINKISGAAHSNADTTVVNLSGQKVRFGNELGLGISYTLSNKLRIEVDYLMSDWSKSNIDKIKGLGIVGLSDRFSAGKGFSVRGGVEYVPNANDIRYFMRRWAYRAGAFYDKSYYNVNGHHLNSYGISMGVTIPVFRWYNSISLGMELGRRSSMQKGLISENFINFTIGFSLFDYWFRQPRYD